MREMIDVLCRLLLLSSVRMKRIYSPMDWITLILVSISLVFLIMSLFSINLMIYTWEHPERLRASGAPGSYLAPRLSFTVLLPARHEEAVIYETIKRVYAAQYPAHLLEIVVVCHATDTKTIAEVHRAIRDMGSSRIRVETFSTAPINKPHGLNVGLQRSSHEVVSVFDAEDDINPNIFQMVNTVMLKEGTGVVQAGVQLMNFADHWFGIHNCLEYFFWFKSGLHFYSSLGTIPLGGNTVFFRRSLLERIGGWDEHCLTEDAEIGLRLSALGESIRVIYDAKYVTREETPESVGAFIRQRTRWHQGFLQILRNGVWLTLPRFQQKLVAGYILSSPLIQSIVLLLWPLNIIEALWLKESVLVTMASFLPLYTFLFQLLITILGIFMFAKEYGLKFSLLRLPGMIITFIPYQILLGISAIRAIYRELRQQSSWEKTAHHGAHRPQATDFSA
jgi:glycosyltransferase XagB